MEEGNKSKVSKYLIYAVAFIFQIIVVLLMVYIYVLYRRTMN